MSKPNKGFVSGHRFGDDTNRQPLAAPLGAEGRLRLRTITLILAIFATAAFAGESSPNQQLPPGAMQEKAAAACSTCHEARIIVQQRLSKPAWAKEVDKMIKWGAEVDPKDRDAMIDYFSTSFGPDQSPYVAPKSATHSTTQTRVKNSNVDNQAKIQF